MKSSLVKNINKYKLEDAMRKYFSSNYKNIMYTRDSEKQQGLRNA